MFKIPRYTYIQNRILLSDSVHSSRDELSVVFS
jgi:hypothetical protein